MLSPPVHTPLSRLIGLAVDSRATERTRRGRQASPSADGITAVRTGTTVRPPRCRCSRCRTCAAGEKHRTAMIALAPRLPAGVIVVHLRLLLPLPCRARAFESRFLLARLSPLCFATSPPPRGSTVAGATTAAGSAFPAAAATVTATSVLSPLLASHFFP